MRAGDIEPAVIGPRACTGLGSFTELLLTGHVRFEGPPARAGAPSVATVRSVCWRCRRDIHLVVALANVPARDLGKLPGVLAAYRRAIPTLNTACGSLTTLRPPPPSRIAAGLRAHCPWCDAPISLHELPAASLAPMGGGAAGPLPA